MRFEIGFSFVSGKSSALFQDYSKYCLNQPVRRVVTMATFQNNNKQSYKPTVFASFMLHIMNARVRWKVLGLAYVKLVTSDCWVGARTVAGIPATLRA